MTTLDKIANAERLAALSRRDSERYAAAGAEGLAAHHAYKADQWAATAADLRAFEGVGE